MLLLEDVYKTSGVPTHTFVPSTEFSRLKVYLRTKGRGLIIEGPSGIGKTTSIIKAQEEMGIDKDTLQLSARLESDLEYIKQILQGLYLSGTIIIDDFHRLSEDIKRALADYMKALADKDNDTIKLILIGINDAGESLIKFANDLNNRVDTIKFEKNPDHKVLELIENGEKALNISISIKHDIITLSQGSFHIAQMLCKETCILDDTTEQQKVKKTINVSEGLVREYVLSELARNFYEPARIFATGPKLRPEGRAPYLHLLKWLAESESWSIRMNDAMSAHPEMKGSINQIVEKGFIEKFILENDAVQSIIHYDSVSKILSIEDPKFLFYIKYISWNKFSKQIGLVRIKFETKYDIALSFSGAERDIALSLFNQFQEVDIETFYDENEQHRILAKNVEDYLTPIYSSEATYVVALLSTSYPQRLWTKFESEQFKKRFGEGSVIPIWFSNAPTGMFDISKDYGGMTLDVEKPVEPQIKHIVDVISRKLHEEQADKVVEDE